MQQVHQSNISPGWALTDLRPLLTYVAAGAVGTAVHFTVLFMTLNSTGPVPASTLGAIAGCIVNYFLARNFVFGSSVPCNRSFPRFITVATFGIVVNATVIKTFVGVLPIAVNQVVASGVVLLLGYSLNKMWTFNDC